MRKTLQRRKQSEESGFTLIELMIAGVVLVFGMLSLMGLIFVAIGNNGRSKIDTTATMLTQGVLEQVSAELAGGGPGLISDNANCNGTGNAWPITYQPGGANLTSGKIDFTQSQGGLVVSGYAMNYVDCANGQQFTYDVRWNIQSIGGSTYLATVGARPRNGTPTRFSFALPVTIRAYVGGN